MDAAVVLVVDDDGDARDAIQELLQCHGYGTAAAEDGREALDLLRSGVRPRVILMDLSMPGMDGFGFRREQLKDPDLADIPFVVWSGRADYEGARHLHADAYCTKPVDPDDLLKLIHRFCQPRLAR